MSSAGWPFPVLDDRLGEVALAPDLGALERCLAGAPRPPEPLRNPHREPGVAAAERSAAVAAAVLVAAVERPDGPTLLLTRRAEGISFAGHVAFPGGRADATDAGPDATALREAHEEVGLSPDRVRPIGRLGEYVTHSGFRIAPVVAIARPPLALRPDPVEVESVLELPLAHALDGRRYRLRQPPHATDRAYWFLEWEGAIVAGPTVSILIGLYETLVRLGAPRLPDAP